MACRIECRVQTDDFVVADEYQKLQQRQCGAVVFFVGLVRDHLPSDGADPVQALELEHYPGMTERSMQQIAQQAAQRFDIEAMTVIHRVGLLPVSAQIVLVAVASAHRAAAFAACEMMMDYLKNFVPIWKKVHTQQHASWAQAKSSDQQALQRWSTAESNTPTEQ